MLTNADLEKYENRAKRILTALDNGKVPIDWAAIDEPELVRIISNELIKIDREMSRE